MSGGVAAKSNRGLSVYSATWPQAFGPVSQTAQIPVRAWNSPAPSTPGLSGSFAGFELMSAYAGTLPVPALARSDVFGWQAGKPAATFVACEPDMEYRHKRKGPGIIPRRLVVDISRAKAGNCHANGGMMSEQARPLSRKRGPAIFLLGRKTKTRFGASTMRIPFWAICLSVLLGACSSICALIVMLSAAGGCDREATTPATKPAKARPPYEDLFTGSPYNWEPIPSHISGGGANAPSTMPAATTPASGLLEQPTGK